MVNTYGKKLLLPGFIILIFVHLAFTFPGLYGDDDIINYARYAANVAYRGPSGLPASSHLQLRWAAIYVTAFFYKLFGINAFTSSLFSALSYAVCGIILHKILRNKKPAIYLLSMTFFFFGRSVVFNMHRLLPDAGICAAVLCMYYAYRSFFFKKQHALLYGICFGAALLFAVITKETILIVLPLFVVLFAIDLFKRRNLIFWKYAAGASVIFVFVYLLFFKITTNDFFFRYKLLQANSYLNICSFDKLPVIYTLKRIGYELWYAMLLNGDFLILLPACAAAIYKKKILYTGVREIDIFCFLCLMACANFMTISFTSYVPLCQAPRHFIFLMPFAAITGGPMLYAYFKEPAKLVALPLLFVIATGIMFFFHGGTTKYLYLFCTLLFCLRYALQHRGISAVSFNVSTVALTALLSINYFIDFFKPLYPYYDDNKNVIEKAFGRRNIEARVFSADGFSGELSEFFLKFQTGKLKFLPADSIQNNNEGELYYLLNGELNNSAKNKVDSLLSKNNDSRVVIIERSNNVLLYKVNNAFLQIMKEQKDRPKALLIEND